MRKLLFFVLGLMLISSLVYSADTTITAGVGIDIGNAGGVLTIKGSTAAVTNGDTTHIPTCDDVYDFTETIQDYLKSSEIAGNSTQWNTMPLSSATIVTNDLIRWDGSNWVRIASGTVVGSYLKQDFTWATPSGGAADNLGSHTATKTLTMAGFDIDNIGEMQVDTITAPSGVAHIRISTHIVMGLGAAGVDYTLTIDGESSDGVRTYDEDNSVWNFTGGITIADYFTGDRAYVNSLYGKVNNIYIQGQGVGDVRNWVDSNSSIFISTATTDPTKYTEFYLSGSGNIELNHMGYAKFGSSVTVIGNIIKNATQWNTGDNIDGEQIGDNTIDDDSIDWGSGAGQIDTDDMPEGSSNLYQLTQEEVEDYAGTMISSGTGTHTRITITYQDATGDMDFVVDVPVGANEVYASGWNADTGVPEKDDIYDYLHKFDADDDGSFNDESWNTDAYNFTITSPSNTYSICGASLPVIVDTPYAITISSISISCSSDPTSELSGSLKYADAAIGFANPTTINSIATTNGVLKDASMASGSVAINKCIYVCFDAQPDTALKWIGFTIHYLKQ